MNDIDRLRELVDVLAEMPGDGRALVEPHIDPEVLGRYAESCSRAILHDQMSTAQGTIDHDEMVHMLVAAYLSAFAVGCAWATMKAGSREK